MHTILLVEDDEADVRLARRAIKSFHPECRLEVAADGAEACKRLFDEPKLLPDLVLLDLNLPKLDGFEVLERIRTSELTHRLPVVVMSSTENFSEIRKCADLNANSFVRKAGLDPEIYRKTLRVLLYYWTSLHVAC